MKVGKQKKSSKIDFKFFYLDVISWVEVDQGKLVKIENLLTRFFGGIRISTLIKKKRIRR